MELWALKGNSWDRFLVTAKNVRFESVPWRYLTLPDSFFRSDLPTRYLSRLERLAEGLREAGFEVRPLGLGTYNFEKGTLPHPSLHYRCTSSVVTWERA